MASYNQLKIHTKDMEIYLKGKIETLQKQIAQSNGGAGAASNEAASSTQ
jgi:hypothetical protein